nr:MAG TPA: hypothetical protein [Bacteriophage sp.]
MPLLTFSNLMLLEIFSLQLLILIVISPLNQRHSMLCLIRQRVLTDTYLRSIRKRC